MSLCVAIAWSVHALILPFHVERDAMWSVHAVKNPAKLQRKLPEGLSLAKVRIFDTDLLPRTCVCVNTFRVHTPLFRGTRSELVTLARSSTGRLHFVVLDCLSDTFTWTPEEGVVSPTITFGSPPWRVAERVRVRATTRNYTRYALSGHTGARVGLTHEFAIEANEFCYTTQNARPIQLLFSESTVGANIVRLRSISCVCPHAPWANVVGRTRVAFLHPHPMPFLVVLPPAFFASMFVKPDDPEVSRTDTSAA